MSDQGTGQPLALPSGATTDPVANGRHKGQMPRWATASATIASFATRAVAGHSDVYVPLATSGVAGALSAGGFAALDLLANPPRARATSTTAQAIASGSLTQALSFTATQYNNVGQPAGAAPWVAGTPTQLFARVSGVHAFAFSCSFAASVGGNVRFLFPRINGATIIMPKADAPFVAGGNAVHLAIAGEVSLSNGDYLEGLAFQDTGGALNVIESMGTIRWVAP